MECYHVGIEMAVHQFVNCGHQSQSVIFSSVCFHCVNGIFFHVRYLCAFLKSVNQLIIAVFHGGEAEALTRLERHLERKVMATDFIQILIELHNYRG